MVTAKTLGQIEKLIGTFREAIADVGIALDLNYNFRTDGVQRSAPPGTVQEHPVGRVRQLGSVRLRQIKDSTSLPIASCESLVTTKQYPPFLELHAMDVCIIDLPWNG